MNTRLAGSDLTNVGVTLHPKHWLAHIYSQTHRVTIRRRAHSSPRKGGDPENTLMLWARGNEGGGFQCLGWCWNVRIYLPCRLPGPVRDSTSQEPWSRWRRNWGHAIIPELREPPEKTGLQLIEKWENQALNSLTPTLPNVLSHPVSYRLKTGVRHPRFQVAEEPQNPPFPS